MIELTGIKSLDKLIYDYKDGIYDNRNNDDTFIRWSGQKKIVLMII